MGLKRRLKRLEEVGKREETRLSREALRYLANEDLDALEDDLEANQENGSATFEDLYGVATERGRRALENLLECIEAVREGRVAADPPRSRRGGETGPQRLSHLEVQELTTERITNGTLHPRRPRSVPQSAGREGGQRRGGPQRAPWPPKTARKAYILDSLAVLG